MPFSNPFTKPDDDSGPSGAGPAKPDVLLGAFASTTQLLSLRFKPSAAKHRRDQSITGLQAGLKLSKIKGRGADFAEVRPYQPGDDVRAIDWRVTARRDKPHTKVFHEQREQPALVLVDQRQSMFFGSTLRLKSVAAAELAARIAWQIVDAGDRVGGIVLDQHSHVLFRPHRVAKKVGRFLAQISAANHQLSRIHTDEIAPITDQTAILVEGLRALEQLKQDRYRIFIVSDFADDSEAWSLGINRLARKNKIHLLQIWDALDSELPPANNYTVAQAQKRISFYSGNKRLREHYSAAFAERQRALADIALHSNINMRSLSTSDSHWDQLSWT